MNCNTTHYHGCDCHEARLKEIADKLASVVQAQYEYIKWLGRHHDFSMADMSPEIGDDEDGSDLGCFGVLELGFNARVALKQHWTGEIMNYKDGVGAPGYEELLKMYGKCTATGLEKLK